MIYQHDLDLAPDMATMLNKQLQHRHATLAYMLEYKFNVWIPNQGHLLLGLCMNKHVSNLNGNYELFAFSPTVYIATLR